jgi:hypothetical protein
MSDRDEQLEVLRAMWGEMKTLNSRVNDLRDDLGSRIDTLREYVCARLDAESERNDARFADLKDVAAIGRLDRRRLDLLERRVDALERRDRT